jgi:transglutaminase-like putative cysteine protease
MMVLQINHHTHYSYSHPVVLEPTILRLTPRRDPSQRCRSFSLNILPEPVFMNALIDENGNSVHTAGFQGETSSLSVKMVCEVETFRSNPFDYIVTDSQALSLPVHYDSRTAAVLESSRGQKDYIYCKEICDIYDMLIDMSGKSTINFLSAFALWISREIGYESRDSGMPQNVRETLLRGKGACRDSALVFIEGCRLAGLAARFVSGYSADRNPHSDNEHNLHAWAEVYLPGAGWRGYDPGSGLAVADMHVALAASPFPETAFPIDGMFNADDSAVSSLETSVAITLQE